MTLQEKLNNNFAKTIQYIHSCESVEDCKKAIKALNNPDYNILPEDDVLVIKQINVLRRIARHKILELKIRQDVKELSKEVNNL